MPASVPKNSQNPIGLVHDYCKICILRYLKTLPGRGMFLLHFSRFKTVLFFGHSKIKVRSCVLCVYAGTPLAAEACPSLHMSKCHIVGNLMPRLNFYILASLYSLAGWSELFLNTNPKNRFSHDP